MKIEKIEKRETVRRCVKPACVDYEETGDIRIVRVRGKDGVERDEEKPVVRQVSRAAEYVEEEQARIVHAVADGDEVHEFADRKAAQDFVKIRRGG